MDWQEELISLYMEISKIYQQKLTGYCCRMSNYANLAFSGEEIITIYMFGIMSKNYKIKDIYDYTIVICGTGFPSYQAIQPLFRSYLQSVFLDNWHVDLLV